LTAPSDIDGAGIWPASAWHAHRCGCIHRSAPTVSVLSKGSSRRGRRKAESVALDPDPWIVRILGLHRRDAERDLRRCRMKPARAHHEFKINSRSGALCQPYACEQLRIVDGRLGMQAQRPRQDARAASGQRHKDDQLILKISVNCSTWHTTVCPQRLALLQWLASTPGGRTYSSTHPPAASASISASAASSPTFSAGLPASPTHIHYSNTHHQRNFLYLGASTA